MQKHTNLVAVFGSLKKGFGNHRVIGDSEFLGTTKTEPKFTMFSFGGFPGLLLEGNTSIEVEVYDVTNREIMNGLDRLEGYPSFYDRTQIETEFGDAWIYFNKSRNLEHHSIIESGVWTR